jgi:hypothetical protein
MIELLTQPFRALAVWQWLVLLSVPPLVVLLYFLKLKRQPLEVPSTYLWHRTIEDLHVNSFWQKLRQNLLLFLQLLLLLLAILACLRPSWQGTALTADRYIFLVDTSASMSATDEQPSRLEAAKEELISLVDQQLRPNTAVMVVSFSDRAIIEQPFTNNRNLLKRKIRAIQPTQRPSQLDEALRVAAGLANPGRIGTESRDEPAAEAMPATLMIYSDGRYRVAPDFAMGNLQPRYVPIGKQDAENVGIVAFSSGSSPDRPDQMQLFGRVQNFANRPVTVTANLVLYNPNRNLLDAAQIELPADVPDDEQVSTRGVEFTIDSFQEGELRLELDHQDAFLLDNVAYVAVNPKRRAKVLVVSQRNDALETVLGTAFAQRLADVQRVGPEFLETPEYRDQAAAGEFDVIVFDECQPPVMPQCNTYFIGAPPTDERWQTQEQQSLPQIIDADRAHPLMRFVELGDLKWIVKATPLNVPTGGTTLIDSHLGPLLAIAPREGFEDLVQAFAIVTTEDGERVANTDWPIRVSFPVFIGNMLGYLGGTLVEANQEFTRPGQSIAIRTERPWPELMVRTPTGQRLPVGRGPDNAFLFGQTESMGVYEVQEPEGGETIQRFAVNLFDDVESNIAAKPAVETQYEEIEGQRMAETKRYEGWKYLLMAALAVLLIEWYIYNQRVYV